MGSIGAPEVLVVLIIALLFLGPERLPKAAKSLGKAVGEFRRVTGGFQAEMRDAVDSVVNPIKSTLSSTPSTTTDVTVDRTPASIETSGSPSTSSPDLRDRPAAADGNGNGDGLASLKPADIALPGLDADWSGLGASDAPTTGPTVDPSLN